jgi:hypothetical protein
MRNLLLIPVIFIGLQCLNGQTAEDEVARLKQSPAVVEVGSDFADERSGNDSEDERSGNDPALIPGWWNISVGTHFSHMGGFGSGTGFYVVPAYTLPLNNRWALHGGVLATGFTMWNSPGAEYQSPSTFSSLALFAAASYRMNDRLILHGSGVKQLATLPLSPLVPYTGDNLSLGATYRLGDNVTIGATIRMRSRNGYYYGSPFHGSYLTSPLGW